MVVTYAAPVPVLAQKVRGGIVSHIKGLRRWPSAGLQARLPESRLAAPRRAAAGASRACADKAVRRTRRTAPKA